MSWHVVSGPRRTRIRGYRGAVWHWTIGNGEAKQVIEVKLSAAAVAAKPSELPAHAFEAKTTRGRSAVEQVLEWAEPPVAIELCKVSEQPFLSGGLQQRSAAPEEEGVYALL